jgi:MFS family permease
LAHLYGVGAAAASLAISGFAAMRLVANLAFSRVLKYWKLRLVLSIGLVVQAICAFASGLAPDFVTFIIFRSVGGLGSAAFTISSTALLVATVPKEIRGRAMSVFFGGTSLGTVSGPAVGGALAVISPRLPLLSYGASVLIASVLAFVLLKNYRDVRATRADIPEGGVIGSRRSVVSGFLSDRVFIAVLSCQLIAGWVFYGMRSGTMPLFLSGLGYSTAVIGILVTVAALVQVGAAQLAGPLSDSRGRYQPIIFGLGMAACSIVVIGLFAQHLPGAIVGFVMYGLASGSVASVSAALLGDSGRGTNPTALSLYWIVSDTSAVVGAFVSGVLAQFLGFQVSFALAVVLIATAMFAVIRAYRWFLRNQRAPLQ